MAERIVNLDFEGCLNRKKLVKFAAAKKLSAKEIGAAREDLRAAQDSLKKKGGKWATIQAYYAMFHAARALLYSRGYREKSHYCLIVSMRVLFVDAGLIDAGFVEAFHLAKVLRENADYENEFSVKSARVLVDKAGKFVERAQDVLAIK